MRLKIISGGQTGVDQAALRAASAVGFETGGWAPLGWKTLEGVNYQLRDIYGLREASSPDYKVRTALNVRDGCATLVLARRFSSGGEKFTLHCIRKLRKPYICLLVPSFGKPDVFQENCTENLLAPALVAHWVRKLNCSVLNIAGNSEKRAPGIGAVVYPYLVELFEILKKKYT